MKKLTIIFMVVILTLCIGGCVGGKTKELKKYIDKDVSSRNQTPDEDNYYSEVFLSDVFRGETKHILQLYSPNVRNEIGEEQLTGMLQRAVQSIHGSLIKFTVKESGGSGNRGNGPDYTSDDIYVYTDMDIYQVSIIRCQPGPELNAEEYDNAFGVELITVRPVSSTYLPDGEIKSDIWGEAGDNKKTGVLVNEGTPAKLETYANAGYTGYSVAIIQMVTAKDLEIGANKEFALELLSALTAEGLSSDISEIECLYERHEKYDQEFQEGYNYHVLGEDGTEFFVRFDRSASHGTHVTSIKR